VTAAVVRQADTIRFDAPAQAYRCEGESDLVIEAVRSNNGVLVWLRLGDSVVRDVPIVGSRDSITRPAAVVTARFSHQAVPHTLALDSGAVTITDSAGWRVSVAGSGLDMGFAVRAGLVATFTPLPATPDSSRSCARVP
jgi:hypothetical protein